MGRREGREEAKAGSNEGSQAAGQVGRQEGWKASKKEYIPKEMVNFQNAYLPKSQLAKNVGQSLWSLFFLVDFLAS